MRPTISRKRKTARRGVAAVEAAVTLPILVVLVLGAIEAANAIFLKQTMTIATYETAKVATSANGTEALAELRCQEVLASRGITDFDLTLTPAGVNATTPQGTQVTVTLTIDADSSIIGPLWFFTDKVLSKQVDMSRL